MKTISQINGSALSKRTIIKLKNIFRVLISRTETVKQRISELEDKSIKSTFIEI